MALVVNGERIEDSDIESAREQVRAQSAGPGDDGSSQANVDGFAKDMVIARVLVQQEARRRDLPVAQDEIDSEIEQLKQKQGGEESFQKVLEAAGVTESDLRKDAELSRKVDALLDEVCKDIPEPSEEELRAYYREHRDAFKVPEQIRAAHIVKHVRGTVLDFQAADSELKEALALLEQGMPFEALAAHYSDCPDNGGDLGYFPRGAMVQEFDDVVFAMKKGEVSPVFRTPYGVHVAKLLDRVPKKERGFNEVKDEIRDAIYRERENTAIDAFTNSLKSKATIEEV